MKNLTTGKTAVVGMLCAAAYVLMVLVHLNLVPGAPFLTYDPKDAVICIGGFLIGPAYAVIISVIVAFLEMLTVSGTGIIGFVMQVAATCAFVLPAAFVYRNSRTRKNAVIGLGLGILSMTAVMLLWNWLLTPLYLGISRADAAKLLVPAILPFNFLKAVINAVLTMLIYKPVVRTLRKARLIEERNQS